MTMGQPALFHCFSTFEGALLALRDAIRAGTFGVF